MIASEEDLKGIEGLRWRLDDDRCVIATTTSRRNLKDHLYFHGPGVLGIYYERPTQLRAKNARRKWLGVVREPVEGGIRGDFDGLILFRANGQGDIPGAFLKSGRRVYLGRKRFARATPDSAPPPEGPEKEGPGCPGSST